MGADFRLGPWLVEPGLNTVSRRGFSVHLEPKIMEVLVCLARQPRKTVRKEQLLKEVWPDTFVTDDVLIRSISELRRVFEDDARNPSIIQTIPKRGYRLIAPVEPINGEQIASPRSPPQVGPEPSRPVRKWSVFALVFGLAIVVMAVLRFGGLTFWFGKSASPQIRSIAVLPLENLSADPTQEYFSDGMTDALITDLAQIGSVKVISRTSIMRYKKTDKALPEIARELNVDGIVEGTVQRSGDRVRITAQLIQGPSDKHLWASAYDGDVHDTFALEREIAEDIARHVQERLTPAKMTQVGQLKRVDAKVLNAYLQGNFFLNRFTEEETRKAQQYFQEAIDTDPAFAPAYVGLALAHYRFFEGSSEDTRIAKRAAERALELDPTLSDARVTLGKIKLRSWDWSGMEQEYRKAIELNPNSANTHQEFGQFLDAMGRLDDGFKECEIAQELDPNQDHLSRALDDRREYDRSIEIKLIMLRKDPDNAVLHHSLYLNYEAKGMYKDAVQHLERAVTLAGSPEVAISLDMAFAVSGYKGAMREYAKQLEHAHTTKQIFLPVNLAGVYATLGDKDRAFYWLEQAYKHSSGSGIPLWEMKSYTALEPLRSDPRFNELIHRIGLPP